MPIDVVTFGCRLNTYESEVMKQHAQNAGLENTIIFNTCTVTAQAEKQARQAIRKARREHPDARIVVTGCAAQVKPELFAAMGEVDMVLGNHEKMQASEWASLFNSPLEGESERDSRAPVGGPTMHYPPTALPLQRPLPLKGGAMYLYTAATEKTRVNDIMSVKETASHLIASFDGRARAFLQVQNGCDHRCTFCIIPFGRGNSRSVPIGEIVTQVRTLVESGYNEIVFTGVDVSDYGKDLPGTPSLGAMMRRVLALVPELKRLRLSSIDAVEVDDELYRLIAEEPRLMPHLHLSLQAGDDMILKRMKRRHNRGDIVAFCEKVRALRPEMVFGADIIAGFPTETDAMFDNTLNLVHELNLIHLHVFPYSARVGTPAARMPQVPMPIRKARAAQLRLAGEAQRALHLAAQVKKTLAIVVEQDGKSGHAEDFTPVQWAEEKPVGSIVLARIARADAERCYAA